MGLLLSALVTCVGVIELITFCRNVRGRLAYRPTSTDLDRIGDGYIRELGDIRRRIYEDLQKLRSESEPDAEVPMPTFRLNSHEDIEIEYDERIANSRSPSPRRFLVTEKERQSPRRFVVTEEPTLKRSKSQSSIPEYLISEERNSSSSISPNNPRYLLEGRPGNDWPVPLPKQFIVTENELNAVVFERPEREEYFRRPHSPYPSLELQHTTRSVYNELVPVDEEQHRARSPSPSASSTFHDRTFETNNEAAFENVSDEHLSKIERELQEALEETSSPSSSFDVDYLNNLDGVNRSKIKRSGGSKKFLRRRNTGSLDSVSSSKHSEDEAGGTNVAKESVDETDTGVRSEEHVGKRPEPFWVKNLE